MSTFEEKQKWLEGLSEAEFESEVEKNEQETLSLIAGKELTKEKSFSHGEFTLTVGDVTTKQGCMDYSKHILSAPGRETMIIPRNLYYLWHLFVDHPNGNQYLLCGHDYQGYDCVNLTAWQRHRFVPREAFLGCGFCWAQAAFDEENLQLVVEGCYWACPYEKVRFDFSNPDVLPYAELNREDLD